MAVIRTAHVKTLVAEVSDFEFFGICFLQKTRHSLKNDANNIFILEGSCSIAGVCSCFQGYVGKVCNETTVCTGLAGASYVCLNA
jgi:hypothetical protein